jgi:transposase-like protein
MNFWRNFALDLFEFEKYSSFIPICTDREQGIVNAILESYPDCNLVFCQNHLIRDVKQWIRNSKGKSDDIKVLKKHLENLLECKSESEFEILFSEYKNLWSKDFLTYFEDNVLLDLKTRSCRIFTNKFAAFKDKIPTNNISESLNKMIKSQND